MDWAEVTLFMVILARMSGMVLFNPLLGRRDVPGRFRSGLIMVLAVTVFGMTEEGPAVPGTIFEMALMLFVEMAMGYVLGVAMNFFLYVPLLGGETIDAQMGMSMGKTYDPGAQASTSVSATMFSTMLLLMFFVENGHHTLLRIIMVSGQIVPFGQIRLGQDVYWAVIELFVDCTILAIKLCMPVLAAELMGQMSMGVLMKVIPQINIFVINIDVKVIIGLGLELLLMAPISEFLLGVEVKMLRSLQDVLMMMGR